MMTIGCACVVLIIGMGIGFGMGIFATMWLVIGKK